MVQRSPITLADGKTTTVSAVEKITNGLIISYIILQHTIYAKTAELCVSIHGLASSFVVGSVRGVLLREYRNNFTPGACTSRFEGD